MTVSGSSSSFGQWTTRTRLFALAIVLAHVMLAWTFRLPIVATGQDDAEYITLAREVSQGNYADAFDRERPRHARYPPGYPAFLATISALVGENEFVFILANVLLTAGAVVLFLVLARRFLSPWAWLAVGAIVGLNPELTFVAGKILSEPLFIFVIYLSLWSESITRSVRGTTLGTVLGALTTLVRSAGLAIAIGLIGARLWQKRWRAAIALTALTVMTGGFWVAYTARMPSAEDRLLYSADFRKVLEFEDRSTASALVQRVKYKAEELTLDELPWALSVPAIPGTPVDNGIAALLIVMLLPLGIVRLWKQSAPAAFVLLAYGALYVVWPYGQVRLIIPVMPLIVAAMFLAAEYIGQRLRWRWATAASMGALAAYLVAGLALRYARDRDYLKGCDKGNAPYSQPACYPLEGDWAFVQAARYARDSIPSDALVFTVKEPSFYYHSGRQAVNAKMLFREDSTTLASALRNRGVEWVVTSNAGPDRRRMGFLVARACRDFELVKRFDDRTMLLRVHQLPDGAPRPDACEALSTWRTEANAPPEESSSERASPGQAEPNGAP